MYYDEPLEELNDEKMQEVMRSFPHTKGLIENKETVDSYYRNIGTFDSVSSDSRTQIFYSCISEMIEEIYGNKIAQEVCSQIRKNCIFSTAEHVGSITNPFTLNTVINQALYRKANEEKYILSLACGTTRLDNVLMSRQVFVGQRKLNLFSGSLGKQMVIKVSSLKQVELEKRISQFFKQNSDISSQSPTCSDLMEWCKTSFESISHMNAFWKQICLMNYQHWKDLVKFNNYDLSPEYIMIPIELLVQKILVKELESNSSSWFQDCFSSNINLTKFISCFEGIRSCWKKEGQSGTYLFWTINEKNGSPVRMDLDGLKLTSKGKISSLELNRENIKQALESGDLIPSGAFSLIYLSFYLGFNLFGGILQIQYLSEMYHRILDDNPLALSPEDLTVIASTHPHLYLNFERRKLSDGGLIQLFKKMPEGLLDEYKSRQFRSEAMGCIGFLADLIGITKEGQNEKFS